MTEYLVGRFAELLLVFQLLLLLELLQPLLLLGLKLFLLQSRRRIGVVLLLFFRRHLTQYILTELQSADIAEQLKQSYTVPRIAVVSQVGGISRVIHQLEHKRNGLSHLALRAQFSARQNFKFQTGVTKLNMIKLILLESFAEFVTQQLFQNTCRQKVIVQFIHLFQPRFEYLADESIRRTIQTACLCANNCRRAGS